MFIAFKSAACQTTLFYQVAKMFMEFDKGLEYPNCEGFEDEKRLTKYYENKFYEILKAGGYKCL